jgi:hypothetical protein
MIKLKPIPFAVLLIAAVLAGFLALPGFARAQELANFNLAIQEHHFDPADLAVPAGVRLTVTVKNLNPNAAEFESSDLDREKVVVGGGSIIVYLGPLTPGSYEFFNDFDPAARGHIVVK